MQRAITFPAIIPKCIEPPTYGMLICSLMSNRRVSQDRITRVILCTTYKGDPAPSATGQSILWTKRPATAPQRSDSRDKTPTNTKQTKQIKQIKQTKHGHEWLSNQIAPQGGPDYKIMAWRWDFGFHPNALIDQWFARTHQKWIQLINESVLVQSHLKVWRGPLECATSVNILRLEPSQSGSGGNGALNWTDLRHLRGVTMTEP